MATRISMARRNGAVDSVVDALDAGAAEGYVEIRTGAQPADPDTTETGTLLATLTLSDPAFGAATGGTATANPITGDNSADATGNAGWFRAYDGDGTPVIDGSVTAVGGGGDMELSSTSIVAGGEVNITSWTFTAPAG